MGVIPDTIDVNTSMDIDDGRRWRYLLIIAAFVVTVTIEVAGIIRSRTISQAYLLCEMILTTSESVTM